MSNPSPNLGRLRGFVQDMTRLVERHGADEPRMLDEGERLLKGLISVDDWLPDEFAAPSKESYRQYLLYCDPLERFSVASFVWMPGHRTPVHDHTVWGLVGVMRGAERCEEFSPDIKKVNSHDVQAGDVDRVSPRIGDVHVVSNAGAETAVSIHVYGANIGAVRRHTYDPATGQPKEFVSGYHNNTVPNLWDRSQDLIPAAALAAVLTAALPASACDFPDEGNTPWRRAVAKVRYLPETEAMVAMQARDRSVVRYVLSLDDPRRVAGRCWWPVEVRVDGKLWKRFLVTPKGDALREDRARR